MMSSYLILFLSVLISSEALPFSTYTINGVSEPSTNLLPPVLKKKHHIDVRDVHEESEAHEEQSSNSSTVEKSANGVAGKTTTVPDENTTTAKPETRPTAASPPPTPAPESPPAKDPPEPAVGGIAGFGALSFGSALIHPYERVYGPPPGYYPAYPGPYHTGPYHAGPYHAGPGTPAYHHLGNSYRYPPFVFVG